MNAMVLFHGDDGRQSRYDFGTLPLPGWHRMLAEAFAWRTGPAGGLRTRESASSCWSVIVRWTRFLAALPVPPDSPDQLTRADVEVFYERAESSASTRRQDIQVLRRLFNNPASHAALPAEAWDAFQRRISVRRETGVPGYTDGELSRLLATLRSEAAAIRQRIRAGEELLRRYREDPDRVDDQQRSLAATLVDIADTGEVPAPAFAPTGQRVTQRRRLASHLHLTIDDLPPLMLLMAALAHRNGETVKELPARHRILDGLAVELVIVKRRHGARRWYETVTWEIGPPGRELHHPGGMYLLILELTSRSRSWCGSPLAICVWRNGHTAGVAGVDEHYAPYAGHLKGATLRLAEWAASRPKPLLADPRPATASGKPPRAAAASASAETKPAVLPVTFNRIKTSMDVRRTKQMGGHLPSAVRSNTMQVLFRNYLTGDPVITDWADEVLGEALVDAEQAALRAHQDALDAAGGALRVITGPVTTEVLRGAGLDDCTAERAVTGQLDTAWTSCTDREHHPVTGRQCQSTLLDCLHCGNCLVTRAHLPRLLTLLDALNARREQMSEQDWWTRYGPAWAAIRGDILAKFSTAERQHAEQHKPQDGLLELVENPWEQP